VQRRRRAGPAGRWLAGAIAASTLAALALSAVGSGVSGASGTSKDKATFCVGGYTDVSYAGPMSGSTADYGKEQSLGLKLAISTFNKAGGFDAGPLKGCKVKLLGPYDDKETPSTGASIASRLVTTSHLLLYFGNVDSGVTLAALHVLARTGIPMINSYSTAPTITDEHYTNIFRTISTSNGFGTALAEVLVNDFHKKNLASLWVDNIFGKGLSHAFNKEAVKLGAKIVVTYSYPETSTDFSVMVSKVKAAHPTGVALLGLYTSDALEVKQLVAAGIKPSKSVKFVGNPSDNNSTFVSIGGGASVMDDTYLIGIWNPKVANKAGKTFTKKFEDTFHSSPAEDAATAYDAFRVFVQAVEHGGGNRSALITQLHKITPKHPYKGITGKLGFKKNGQAAFYPPILLEVVNGAIQAVPTP
jgi:branched-chain amino acid transport system substrate-binding protein